MVQRHAVAEHNFDQREALLAAVADISATLRAAIDDEERERQLARSSSDALYASGVLHMKLPAVLGGGEADLVTQFEVLEAVTRVSPAAGWCSMVGTTSVGMPGAFLPDAGVEQMFAGGRIPRGAILIMPSGRATSVDGGYRLTGRWAFASGVQHAEWVSAHGLVTPDGGGDPALHMFVFPASEMTLHDNWQVLGLRGTGSCDISVDDIFVPDALCWNVAEQPPQRGGPLYRLGIPAFVSYEHAAFACGVARAALDELTTIALKKKRGYGPGAGGLADRGVVQRLIGRGDLALQAARALAVKLNGQAMAAINRGESIDSRLALELRGSAVYCTEVATDIIGDAFRVAGAAAVYEGSAMQRYLRDINVAGQHLMVSDIAYELLGRTHLGESDVPPMG